MLLEYGARPGRWHGTLVVRRVGGGGGGPRPQAEPGWRLYLLLWLSHIIGHFIVFIVYIEIIK